MRTSYAWIAMLILLAACKKETATSSREIASNVEICFGNTWENAGTYPFGIPNCHLVYNNKVYVPQNANGNASGDMKVYIYDGTSWVSKSSQIPLYTNYRNIAFTIGNKGYVGYLGPGKLFYEYDFAANTWTRKADFPGSGEDRQRTATFVIGNKGYVVGGINYYHNNIYNETWQYNQATDNWSKKADLPLARYGATGFSIGNKGYIVNGKFALGYLTSLLEYDQSANTWSFKANFPGEGRIESQCFVISGNAYVGGGEANPQLQDFYKYDPGNNSWSKVEDIPTSQSLQNSFSINSYGYVAWYNYANGNQKMEKYTPRICGSFKSAN